MRGQTHPGSSARNSYIESFNFQPEWLNRNRVINYSVPKPVKIAKSRVWQNPLLCISSKPEVHFRHTSISPNSELRGRQTHPSTSATPSYIESFHFQPERLNGNRVIHFSVPKSVKITKSRVGQNLSVCVCAHRELNRLPSASQSDALPTRVFSPQKIALLRISYASKIGSTWATWATPRH